MYMRIKHALAGAMLAGLAALIPYHAQAADPVRVSITDSSDADFVAYVYGGVMEQKGHNVEYIRIDYSAQIAALEAGDLDVATSMWETTSWHAMQEAEKAGQIGIYGSSGVEVTESWWYPKYLEEVCPGLPNWEALKQPDCQKALSTVETAPSGRFLDAPADWETDVAPRMEALGLDYEVVNSGSAITMVAAMRAAIDRNEPIIGWGYIPHWFYNKTPGGFVELPAADEACFEDKTAGPNPDATYDCGYNAGHIWKIGSVDLEKRLGEAARVLKAMTLPTDPVAEATDRAENGGEKVEAIAHDWIAKNKDTWNKW